jgi:hypothetical protein
MSEPGGDLLIRFGARGDSGAFCRTGWAQQAEPGETWTSGPESTLDLPRPSVPGRYVLELQVSPSVEEDKAPVQRLTVLVNENVVGDFFVNRPTTLKCAVPWWLLAGFEKIAVTFLHPYARSPRDISGEPDDREIALAFSILRLSRRLGATIGFGEADSAAPSGSVAVDELSSEQLFACFENLGENSEFGLVQRSGGVVAAGLLQFAKAPLPILLAGLRARFVGVGNPDQIDVRMAGEDYGVVDKRFGFVCRPLIDHGYSDAEEIRAREAKERVVLREKLIGDLEQAKKIFVYTVVRRTSEPLIQRLVTAVRAYGSTTLLWVELEDEDHPAGTVEALRPGLLKGYLDRFAAGDDPDAVSAACWDALCRNAYRMVHVGVETSIQPVSATAAAPKRRTTRRSSREVPAIVDSKPDDLHEKAC